MQLPSSCNETSCKTEDGFSCVLKKKEYSLKQIREFTKLGIWSKVYRSAICKTAIKRPYLKGFVEDASPIVDFTSEMDYSAYMQMHSTIVSKKQRSQYAKEFNAQYEEYLKLHARMRDISEKFTYLENCLLQCEEGSNEFKKIRAKIQKESETTLQNNDYICAWKKFNFLQSKLSLIKSLIKDYDSHPDKES